MGTAASVESVNGWSEKDLAAQIAGLGTAFKGYGPSVLANALDGSTLLSLDNDGLNVWFEELGVKKAHRTRLAIELKAIGASRMLTPRPEPSAEPNDGPSSMKEYVAEAKDTAPEVHRRFAGFLSHFKLECGSDARIVHEHLKKVLSPEDDVFLDSDDLSDLRLLLEHVKNSKTLVLLQSKSVLTRPWVILELFTAIINDVPIVSLSVHNAFPYDYVEAMEFLMHFDESIEITNPRAAQLLIDMHVDPVDVAWRLSDCLPKIISTSFFPNGSSNAIRASMLDLADMMARATPMQPTCTKKEWLAKRELRKSSVSPAQTKTPGLPHEYPRITLARIPATVPELPNAYVARENDLQQLKAALLVEASGSQNKVGAHGMGGVGKSTIAAALVRDKETREAFEKIVWVTVGQDPDLRELSDSIHLQLTDASLGESAKSAGEVLVTLQNAAKDQNVLLVLDDVWDQSHEKALNCINLDNASRLLVTTRIRGLIKKNAEVDVGVLSQAEALKLILSSADTAKDVEKGSPEHLIALEIVELCGNLPLTLAIAGGMVANNGQGFTDDILVAMKESHDLEDEEGHKLEDRVISSSVNMMLKRSGKNKDLVHTIFLFFAVFPEDIPVPASFFNKIALVLSKQTSEIKARLSVGSCLGKILKFNLIKGSLAAGQGVYMHDVIREYVISQHSEGELRLLQNAVVEAILASRPKPDGFPTAEHAVLGSFEGYVARQLYVHFRGALEHEQEPPDAWLTHSDSIVKKNVAMAVGLGALLALSEIRTAAGELVRAAEALWAASLLNVSRETYSDLVHRSAAKLECADSKESLAFEHEVLSVAWLTDAGSDRAQKASNRQKLLAASTEATFETKTGQAMAAFTDTLAKMGMFGGEGSIEDALPSFRDHATIIVEAAELAANETLRNYAQNLWGATVMGYFINVTGKMEGSGPRDFGIQSEESIIKGLHFYDFHVCGRILKQSMIKIDGFRSSSIAVTLVLRYGNLEALDQWYDKVLEALLVIDLPSSKDFASEATEVANTRMFALPLLMMLDQAEKASQLLKAMGLTWDKDGFENYEIHFADFISKFPPYEKTREDVLIRLFIYLTSADGTIDEAEVNAWIPSPIELAKLEQGNTFLRRWAVHDITSFGARAFLKLGRDDDAAELARLTVAPEQMTDKKTTLVACHSILGQVAAKRGQYDEADNHFRRALEEAKLSRLPMLEVLAARDWKKHALEPAGRDLGDAEAVIDSACEDMRKTRAQLMSVLG